MRKLKLMALAGVVVSSLGMGGARAAAGAGTGTLVIDYRDPVIASEIIPGFIYALKSVSGGGYLDGRISTRTDPGLSYRSPIRDQYLHWNISRVDGHWSIKSISGGGYLDGRISTRTDPGLSYRSPSGDKYLQWDISRVDGHWSIKSISGGGYLDGRISTRTDPGLSYRSPSGDKYLQWDLYKVGVFDWKEREDREASKLTRAESEVSSLRAEIASVRKISGDEVARMSGELSSLRSKVTAVEAEKTTLLDEVRRFRELVPSPTSTSEELKFHRYIVDRILEE